MLSSYSVTSASDGTAPDTLRWAILQVDHDTQQDTIDFAIPGGGLQSIHLASPLPAITNSVVIDGASQSNQPNYTGAPLIQIDGSGLLGSGNNGLVVSAGSSTIEGLAIVGFTGSGIVLTLGGGDVVSANYLGLSPVAGQAGPNGTGISIVGSSNNTIGGSSATSANVISGNNNNGISIDGSGGSAAGNDVLGNLIGTNPAGTGALENTQNGIVLTAAAGTEIGIGATGFGNVISGNFGAGIELLSGTTGTTIQNNDIGVAFDGKTALGNGGDGIYLSDSPSNQIGGTDLLQGNLIGANHGNGISALGNSTELLVEGNLIGTDVSTLLNLGNEDNGVSLASSLNTIGGTASGAANTIDNNGTDQPGSGVQLVGNVTNDEILSNSIYGNAILGINLGDGPTPNHAPGTAGPNDDQNYPTLTTAQSDGTTTTVQGSLFSSPNADEQIQIFSSPSKSLSGFGQGKQFMGSFMTQTDANGSASFAIPIPVGMAPGQYLSATATDSAGNTSEFALDVQAVGQVNLVLSGSYSPNPVVSGGQVTYTLSVNNYGNIAANNVFLTNQLPAGVKFVYANPSQGTIEPGAGSSLVASLGTIAAGGAATVTVVGQTSSSTVGTIADTASVSSQDANPSSATESVTIETTVVTSADMSVQLTAGPSSDLVGSELTYTITATNNGNQQASDVTVTLPITAGESFLSTDAQSFTNANGQVVADLGNLAVNAQATIEVEVELVSPGPLVETASVSSTSYDPNLANNTSTVSIVVAPVAGLRVAISASASPVIHGDEFEYTVKVTDVGPDDGTGVVLTDTLPAGVHYVLATSDQNVTPTESAGVVTLSFPTLQAGSSATMTILVDPTAAPGTTLTDFASVTHDESDPVPANESAQLVTPVRGLSDLGITSTSQPAPAYVGQNITYLLNVSNQGPNDEPDASVSWPIPGDANFVSAFASQGDGTSINQAVVNVDLGLLRSGQTLPVTLTITPLAGAAGLFTTTFSVQGENGDPNLANNSTPVSVPVTPAADLKVAIVPGQSGPDDGLSWTYTLRVTNLGLSNATGVTVSSPVPSSLGFNSATPSQGNTATFLDGVISATLGSIPAGQSANVSIVVMPASPGPISLAASVSGDQYDPASGNNTTSDALSVTPSNNMSVTLIPQSSSALSGASWSFIASLENLGPDPATNVVLTFPMASGLIFGSATPSQGSYRQVGSQIVAQLGTVDPGSTATVKLFVTAPAPGVVVQTATVTAADNQLDSQTMFASATVTVLESAGILQFASASYAVPENAGFAQLIVTRTDGSKGPATVGYQTQSENATPGLDYVFSAGTLSFAAGQTSAMIQIPVLADPWDNHDEYVNVVLSSPGDGAMLGPVGTSLVRIIDIDPNNTPPQVTALSWTGTSASITSLNVSFTAPLDQAYALNPADYQLVAPGLGNRVIPLTPQSYNSSNFSVTLAPAVPLPSGQFYEIQLIGSGPSAIRDIAGNLLDGASNGQAGTNYQASFGQGKTLKYVDGNGNKVSLKLAGSGYLEQVRNAAGEGVLLELVGIKPHHSTLSGTVKATASRAVKNTKRPAGSTELGTIQGLGSFGQVKVLLTSPPFLVTTYPFQRRGKNVL